MTDERIWTKIEPENWYFIRPRVAGLSVPIRKPLEAIANDTEPFVYGRVEKILSLPDLIDSTYLITLIAGLRGVPVAVATKEPWRYLEIGRRANDFNAPRMIAQPLLQENISESVIRNGRFASQLITDFPDRWFVVYLRKEEPRLPTAYATYLKYVTDGSVQAMSLMTGARQTFSSIDDLSYYAMKIYYTTFSALIIHTLDDEYLDALWEQCASEQEPQHAAEPSDKIRLGEIDAVSVDFVSHGSRDL